MATACGLAALCILGACDEQPDRPALDARAPRDRGPNDRGVAGDAEAGPSADQGPPADAGPRTSATFSPTTQDFPNPERGFYAFTTDLADLDTSELTYVRDTLGLRLAFVPTKLDAYLSQALPQSYLSQLTARFALVRAGGVKLVLRFAYNYDAGGQDAPLSLVQQHIGQLAPLLKANADVIAYLQAGFIGAWGEWHTSSSNLTTDANRAAVRDALLAAAPTSQIVQFRYPPDLIKWYPTVLEPSQALGATDQARIGSHNDCFLSSDTDVGTYSGDTTLGDQQRAYVKALSALTPYGGETCDASDASQQRRSCAAILAEGRDYHLTYLNVSYYTAFHQQWKSEGCYDEVARSMGYRFQLDAISHPMNATPGATLTAQVDLRNVGWSRLFSARKLTLTLRHQVSGALISGSGDTDLRTLPAQATASTPITVTLSIPAGAASGDYDVLLGAPDIYPTTSGDARHAIRFANADDQARDQAWEPTTARFRAGTRVSVP
jgi:hypothetical protein